MFAFSIWLDFHLDYLCPRKHSWWQWVGKQRLHCVMAEWSQKKDTVATFWLTGEYVSSRNVPSVASQQQSGSCNLFSIILYWTRTNWHQILFFFFYLLKSKLRCKQQNVTWQFLHSENIQTLHAVGFHVSIVCWKLCSESIRPLATTPQLNLQILDCQTLSSQCFQLATSVTERGKLNSTEASK